ncbi:hypothetical protein PR003_g21313 [Phytophthora rubi]|uniref:EGF-like domain-containing protein n=1 Tax=Phytophthora rubi TaxID=129364 RepID=A0A6A4DH37_9STRA|nr:hypothetical protein PR003_g21313 [Phytophthora rubi]
MGFPSVCTSRSLYHATALWLLWSGLLQVTLGYTCPNYCSSRGLCLTQGLCTCPNGWSGPDCSIASCPLGEAWADQVIGTDDGHNLAPCSNRGVCELDTGTCTCDSGFTGAACERSAFSIICWDQVCVNPVQLNCLRLWCVSQ